MRKLFLLTFALIFGGTAFGQATILSEDFEAGSPPTGWSQTQNTPSVGWEYGSNLGSAYFAVPAHTRYACSNDDAHDDNSTTANDASMDYLISPAMDLTPYASTGVVLTFSYVQSAQWGSTGAVEVSTDGGSTWSVAWTVDPASSWADGTVDLSTYTSSANVMIAFHHNDNGNWGDGFAVDDVVVREVPAYDASMDEVTTSGYVQSGSTDITGVISNQGYQTITSVDLEYTINGGTPVSGTVSGLSLALGQSTSFTHPTPTTFAACDIYDIEVTVTGVNSMTDENSANDMNSASASVLTMVPTKNVVLEDHTGAWCQFCPDGTVKMEEVLTAYPDNVFGVAVHNGDAMTIAEGTTLQNEYITGYPSGLIDHYLFPDASEMEVNRGNWMSRVGERLNDIAPVYVDITQSDFNSTTREVTITIDAVFVGPATGDLRINAWLIEDNVTGTGSGYDQVNYYNTQTGHPYAGAGNPIVGFVHNHTLRAMLGGTWGDAGVISSPTTCGTHYTKTYTYTLPSYIDENEVKVLGVVSMYDADNTQRTILNSIEADLGTTVVGVEEPMAEFHEVYPNPFNQMTNIAFGLNEGRDVTLEVYDMFGKRVSVLNDGFLPAGEHKFTWNGTYMNSAPAASGTYMVVLTAGNTRQIEKVILSR